jgi:amino acid transporter
MKKKGLGKLDAITLAFGAMIGWGWVVMSGEWITKAGTFGAILAFILGGIMVLFVGKVYAELTSAMPRNGGCQEFSKRAFGKKASFICTWSMILGYIAVIAFEAVAFPSVLQYLFPGYVKGYMYTVNGSDIYVTWVLVGVISSLSVAAVNYFGTKNLLQTACTLIIAAVGLALMGGSAVNGSMANIDAPVVNGAAGIITVAVMTPFMLMGFDVIPQAAGEMNIPYKKIGKLLVLSVVMAIFWYAMIIFGVSLSMTSGELAVSGMASADAMQKAYMGSAIASKVLIMGGICGIITSWNSFYVGCSHAICAMAEEGMLPSFLAKKHKKYGTPVNAILLIAAVTSLAPFLGENMLTWLSNAGAFAIVIAYFLVSASFIKLRRKEPKMERPYKVKYGMFTGVAAVVCCGIMLFMYIPGAPAAMSVYEWSIVLLWAALGVVFYMAAMKKQRVGVVYHTKRLMVKQAVFMGMK